jgi:FMN phosphatase YigB (HAD superfamily)
MQCATVWGGLELFHDLELARHFEHMVVSARVGFQKPAEGIFRHALELMSVSPERAWHVGDSYQADVQGARRAGINGVMIARDVADTAFMRQEHDDSDLVVVTDLFELLDLLTIERPALSPA